MRHWNFFDQFLYLLLSIDFYPTYEALKLQSVIFSYPLPIFHFYPTYEALKHYATDKVYDGDFLIFTLPMRHWNDDYKDWNAKQIFNFYPTYEALKLLRRCSMDSLINNFYPTYEALKPSIMVMVVGWKYYFYPTYEALKLRMGKTK